jgi:hypothetical protein
MGGREIVKADLKLRRGRRRSAIPAVPCRALGLVGADGGASTVLVMALPEGGLDGLGPPDGGPIGVDASIVLGPSPPFAFPGDFES